MHTLSQFMAEKGFFFPPSFDGSYQRDGSKWFRGVEVPLPGKVMYVARFGDWKQDTRFDWMSEQPQDPKEAQALEEALTQFKKAESEERRRIQVEVADSAQGYFQNCIDRGTTPYLLRKQIPALYGARIDPDRTDRLLVPARDIQGRLWGYQRILAEKIQVGSDWVDKFFLKGMRIDGCFHLIGDLTDEPQPPASLLVAEGFATGASLHLATGLPVACAFNAGNLESVCRALRAEYPAAKILVCGDEDLWTQRKDGTPWNPGREKATAAAHVVGGRAVFPRFSSLDSHPTDFNDAHCLDGLGAVKAQIEQALSGEAAELTGSKAAPDDDSGSRGPTEMGPGAGGLNTNDIPALPVTYSKAGIPQVPRQQRIVEHLLKFFEGKLVKQDRELFLHIGSHWRLLTLGDQDRLRMAIQKVCAGLADTKHIDATFKLLMYHADMPPVGVDLFTQRPDRANFLNGTLHLGFKAKTPAELAANPGSGAYRFHMDFKPHRAGDYCTTVLPLDYRPASELPVNEEFEEMLKRVWPASDPDQEAKIWLYKEILGSALVPLFPKIFFFVGEPQSGKSTLLALVRKLLGPDNVSSVDPSRWTKEFQMQPMINKLANIHEDISTTKLIDDSIMKSIIDGLPLAVNRKNKDVVQARLPALHTYGCNDMPKSLEGGSGAYDRRAIIVRTTTPQAGQGGGGEFSTWIWERGPEGILRAALEGLARLLANGGQFTRPDSSRAEVKKWGMESDPVAQFIDAVEHGEIAPGSGTITVRESASIGKRVLYKEAVAFWMESRPNERPMSEIAFCKRLRQDKRFVEQRDEHGRSWSGIGLRTKEEPKGPF